MPSEIVLSTDGSQNFSTTLDDVVYDFKISYNTRVGIWTADIYQDNIAIVEGIALVGGVDIDKQFTFKLKNLFTVNLSNSNNDAGPDDIGITARLFKFLESEVPAGG